MTTYRFLPPLVQRHWTLMDHSHGLDRHSISSSWEVKSRAVCNWKHALFIQVFITLGLQGYSPSYRTRLQNLKQVSRTPCLLWLSLITRDSWESQKESDSVELVLQQRLKYPLVKEVLWSLQNTGTWHLADTQYTGLRIEFHFFLLKLVIMSMFIIQNFNISIHFNKPCLKKKSRSLLLQLVEWMWLWGDGFVEGKALLAILPLSHSCAVPSCTVRVCRVLNTDFPALPHAVL